MKRDWKIIRLILEQAECDRLSEFTRQSNFPDDISKDEFLGHLELLSDVGILKNVDVARDMNGRIIRCIMTGVFVTMEGRDLLDALRDSSVWSRIKDKARAAGVSISWEFIKAAIPVIMKEILK